MLRYPFPNFFLVAIKGYFRLLYHAIYKPEQSIVHISGLHPTIVSKPLAVLLLECRRSGNRTIVGVAKLILHQESDGVDVRAVNLDTGSDQLLFTMVIGNPLTS